jgi:hypothetical protein
VLVMLALISGSSYLIMSRVPAHGFPGQQPSGNLSQYGHGLLVLPALLVPRPEADGFFFGFPTRYGSPAAQFKA